MKDKETRLSLGATLSFSGLLLLLNTFGFLKFIPFAYRTEMLDWRTCLLYAALFFLIFKKEKTIGLVLLIIGLIFRFRSIYGLIATYSHLILPIGLLGGGLILLLLALRKG